MIEYLLMRPEGVLPNKQSASYRCILIADTVVSNEWMNTVATWLVSTGCLYCMAWGEQGSLWDDAVDRANLEAFDYEHIPDEKFVMTTWHDNETLYDVFFFAQACAIHMAVDLDKTMILHIAEHPNEEQLINLFLQVKNDIENGNV